MSSDNITIVIEGRKFATSKKLLIKQSEYFENLFGECKDLDDQNEIVIENQDPVLFEHLIKHFENITYEIPEEYIEKSQFFLLKNRSDEALEVYKKIKKEYDNIDEIVRRELIKKIKTYEYVYYITAGYGNYEDLEKRVYVNQEDAHNICARFSKHKRHHTIDKISTSSIEYMSYENDISTFLNRDIPIDDFEDIF